MKNILFLALCYCISLSKVNAQWVQKQNFPGATSVATSFSLGSMGYVLTGDSTSSNFWEFNPANNTWTAKANFPGKPRTKAVAFTISNTGYIVAGSKPGLTSTPYNDMWAYDPGTNTWTQKASLPANARTEAAGFAIGSKGYIGGGWYSDFWEYNSITNTWAQRANIPFGPLSSAVGFSINGKGYMGTGDNGGSEALREFWEYDPGTNTWTRKADFGGGPRIYATGFSLNGKGYLGTGYLQFQSETDDLWEYNPANNTWTQMPDMGALGRFYATSLAIGPKGYVGLGRRATGSGGNEASLFDFWEFTPSGSVGISKPGVNPNVNIFPNPGRNGIVTISPVQMGSSIKLVDVTGKIAFEKSNSTETSCSINLPPGIYFATIVTERYSVTRKVVVN